MKMKQVFRLSRVVGKCGQGFAQPPRLRHELIPAPSSVPRSKILRRQISFSEFHGHKGTCVKATLSGMHSSAVGNEALKDSELLRSRRRRACRSAPPTPSPRLRLLGSPPLPSTARQRSFFSTSALVSSRDDVLPTFGVTTEIREEREALLRNPSSIRSFVDQLRFASSWNQTGWDSTLCRSITEQYDACLQELDRHPNLGSAAKELLACETVVLALKVLTKTGSSPSELATTLKSWERILGKLGETELTDHLSLRLLSANAKAGQVGRVLALLRLRGDRRFEPRPREFQLAIRSIRVAQRSKYRERNLFLGDSAAPEATALPLTLPANLSDSEARPSTSLPTTSLSASVTSAMMATAMPLDDPTRWLDAILLNMKSRKVPLTPQLASQMLWCYSSGYTGKATHHFYRVKRRPLPGAVVVSADESPDDNVETAHSCYASTGSTPGFTTEMPVRRYWDRENRIFERRYTKVHLEHNSCSPPFYKVPSLVGRQSLQYQAKSQHVPQELDRSANNPFPSDHRGLTKLDMEQDPGYSPALNAAFEFASSVRLGAAGHPGVDLNPSGLAALVSACVTRGALWRALQIVEDHEKEPRRGSTVSVVSYNILLTGLARVGDVRTMQDVTGRMLSSGLKPNSSTVRAIVTGLLNLGDVGSAITVVQDSFNQHGVLPPVTTLVTIVEHCLSRDMVFEAKRCVYFVQQLWKWTQTTYDTPEMARFMGRIQSHPQLQRSAIESLFAYFGYRLDDSDFF